MNLKVGEEAHSLEIFLSYPSTCLALQVQFVTLVSTFVMVSTVWSVSCSTHSAPIPSIICKSAGGHMLPCSYGVDIGVCWYKCCEQFGFVRNVLEQG